MLKQHFPFHSSTFIIISLFFMAIMKTLTFCVTRTAESTLHLQVPEDTRHTTGTSLPATYNTYTVQIHDPPHPQILLSNSHKHTFYHVFFCFKKKTIIQIIAILKRQDLRNVHHWPDCQILQFLSPCLLILRTRTKTQKERTMIMKPALPQFRHTHTSSSKLAGNRKKMHLNYH